MLSKFFICSTNAIKVIFFVFSFYYFSFDFAPILFRPLMNPLGTLSNIKTDLELREMHPKSLSPAVMEVVEFIKNHSDSTYWVSMAVREKGMYVQRIIEASWPRIFKPNSRYTVQLKGEALPKLSCKLILENLDLQIADCN